MMGPALTSQRVSGINLKNRLPGIGGQSGFKATASEAVPQTDKTGKKDIHQGARRTTKLHEGHLIAVGVQPGFLAPYPSAAFSN